MQEKELRTPKLVEFTSGTDTLANNGNDSFHVATNIHDPLNDDRPCLALTNAETSSSSALDSVEFSPDPAVCVSYQISPLKRLSMSAQYGAATNVDAATIGFPLGNGTARNEVKVLPNEISPFVATYNYRNK